jgi:hypothetical protein
MLAVVRAEKPMTLGGTYDSDGKEYRYFLHGNKVRASFAYCCTSCCLRLAAQRRLLLHLNMGSKQLLLCQHSLDEDTLSSTSGAYHKGRVPCPYCHIQQEGVPAYDGATHFSFTLEPDGQSAQDQACYNGHRRDTVTCS